MVRVRKTCRPTKPHPDPGIGPAKNQRRLEPSEWPLDELL